LTDDATGSNGTGEAALARALAAAHDTYSAALGMIETDPAAGQVTAAQAQAAAAAASAAYERDCALARVAADNPGWETFVGVGGVLYARRPLTSPPWTVRAASPQALRVEIARKEAGR
jgi:hypothetical protein